MSDAVISRVLKDGFGGSNGLMREVRKNLGQYWKVTREICFFLQGVIGFEGRRVFSGKRSSLQKTYADGARG